MNDFKGVSIDKVITFWNNRPCNLKHSDKPIGTIEYFEEVTAKKYKVEPHILPFSEFAKYKDKSVLEIGCGIGTMSISFAQAGAKMTMIDISDKSLELCKKRFETYGLQGTFYQGNCEELSTFLPFQQFDLIYSFGVIHHTPHPEQVIDEIKKYLKIGGEFKMMVYSKFSYKLFWIMKESNIWDFSQLNSLIANYSEAQSGCPVTYSYTFDDIKKLLGDRFEIKEIYKDHIFPYKIEKYIKNEYELEDCFKNMPLEEFKKMEKELGWHTMVKAIKL